ncbi:MAG: MFS transporter [Acidimicrobiales bacterium]
MDRHTIHRRRWLILPVLCLSLFLVVVDNTIVNVALPTLSRELGATTSQLQWIVDAYALVFAGLLLAGGSLGDRVGRKRSLQVGLVLFAATSVLAAFAGSAGALIWARAAMGVGAALVFPATLAILTNVFTDPAERAKAIGIWAGVSGLAVALGPISGGWLLRHFWWGSVFFVNVPIVVVALVAGQRLLPESRDPHAGRFDRVGFLASIAAITSLIYTVIEAPHRGWTDPDDRRVRGRRHAAGRLHRLGAPQCRPAARRTGLRQRPVLRRQRCGHRQLLRPVRLHLPRHPVLPVRAGLRHVLGRGAHPALRRRRRRHRTDQRPPGAAHRHQGGGGRRAGAHGRRLRDRLDDAGRFLVLGRAGAGHGADGLRARPGRCAGHGVDHGLAAARAGRGGFRSERHHRELGGTLGVAVVGSVFSSIYGPRIAEGFSALPGLPAEAVEAARDSMAAAVQVAAQAPAAAQPLVLGIARDAFMDGMATGSRVAAVACAVGAVAALRFLPPGRWVHPPRRASAAAGSGPSRRWSWAEAKSRSGRWVRSSRRARAAHRRARGRRACARHPRAPGRPVRASASARR